MDIKEFYNKNASKCKTCKNEYTGCADCVKFSNYVKKSGKPDDTDNNGKCVIATNLYCGCCNACVTGRFTSEKSNIKEVTKNVKSDDSDKPKKCVAITALDCNNCNACIKNNCHVNKNNSPVKRSK